MKESTDSTQASGAGAKEKGDSTAKTTKTQSKLSKTVKQVPVETTVDHSVLETLEVFDLTDNEAWVRIFWSLSVVSLHINLKGQVINFGYSNEKIQNGLTIKI